MTETAWERRTRREAARAVYVAEHGNVCELCGNPPKSRGLSEDHDHKTGAHRGWLCFRCNRALPTYATLEWLRLAVAYLERAEGCPVSSEALERAAKESRATYVEGTPEKYPRAELRGFTILEAEALLAEVARLERAAEHAEQQRAEYAKAWVDQQFRLQEAEAALAVAREREQRLREALEAIATLRLDEGLTTAQAMTRARIQMQTFARAALVDEPAAATLAEPGSAKAPLASASPPDGIAVPPGSASAAADEPGETP